MFWEMIIDREIWIQCGSPELQLGWACPNRVSLITLNKCEQEFSHSEFHLWVPSIWEMDQGERRGQSHINRSQALVDIQR